MFVGGGSQYFFFGGGWGMEFFVGNFWGSHKYLCSWYFRIHCHTVILESTVIFLFFFLGGGGGVQSRCWGLAYVLAKCQEYPPWGILIYIKLVCMCIPALKMEVIQ